MAFPGPYARIYYNEAGEPEGWDMCRERIELNMVAQLLHRPEQTEEKSNE